MLFLYSGAIFCLSATLLHASDFFLAMENQTGSGAWGGLRGFIEVGGILVCFFKSVVGNPFFSSIPVEKTVYHTQAERSPRDTELCLCDKFFSAFRFTLILTSVRGKWHLWNCQKEPNNRLVATESLWTGKTWKKINSYSCNWVLLDCLFFNLEQIGDLLYGTI